MLSKFCGSSSSLLERSFEHSRMVGRNGSCQKPSGKTHNSDTRCPGHPEEEDVVSSFQQRGWEEGLEVLKALSDVIQEPLRWIAVVLRGRCWIWTPLNRLPQGGGIIRRAAQCSWELQHDLFSSKPPWWHPRCSPCPASQTQRRGRDLRPQKLEPHKRTGHRCLAATRGYLQVTGRLPPKEFRAPRRSCRAST